MNKAALRRQKFDMKQNHILFLLSSFIETLFRNTLRTRSYHQAILQFNIWLIVFKGTTFQNKANTLDIYNILSTIRDQR